VTETVERPAPRTLGRGELTGILAMSMALTALGIDLMLPAFPAIREDFGLAPGSSDVTRVVTTYMFGLGVGTFAYGPLADRFGRKPVLYVGYGLYAASALAAALAPSLGLVLVARFVWGLGAAGPRVITLAVIRDTFEGERMSRAMSFVMAVFIIVPVFAPTAGQVVAEATSWRWAFGLCVVAAAVLTVWALRLPETLHPEFRLPLSGARIAGAARRVLTTRPTLLYGLAQMVLYGAFVSWIASSEVIVGEVFDQADLFPVVFGGLAAVMGAAMLANARIVERVGTTNLARRVLVAYVVVAAANVAVSVATEGKPPLVVFLAGMAAMVSAHALLIPNFNALAMAPMAAVAGTASSVIGAMQLAGGSIIGAVIDARFDGTVRPLALSFLLVGLVAAGLAAAARKEPA